MRTDLRVGESHRYSRSEVTVQQLGEDVSDVRSVGARSFPGDLDADRGV